MADTVVEETERADGVHGLGAWALAVVMGAILATLIGAATVSRTSSARSGSQASAAEPPLSYELDRLFRAARRAPNVDLSAERAEAGRILLTTSSHTGISSDDRAYPIQQVGALTGLSPADSERRVEARLAAPKRQLQGHDAAALSSRSRSPQPCCSVQWRRGPPRVLVDGTEMGAFARLDGAVECVGRHDKVLP